MIVSRTLALAWGNLSHDHTPTDGLARQNTCENTLVARVLQRTAVRKLGGRWHVTELGLDVAALGVGGGDANSEKVTRKYFSCVKTPRTWTRMPRQGPAGGQEHCCGPPSRRRRTSAQHPTAFTSEKKYTQKGVQRARRTTADAQNSQMLTSSAVIKSVCEPHRGVMCEKRGKENAAALAQPGAP